MRKKIVSLFLCTLLITVISTAATNIQNNEKEEPVLILARIDITENQEIFHQNLDIVGRNPGEWIDIIISEQELSDLNLEYDIIIPDVIEYDNSIRGQYYTYPEIEDIIEDIADDNPSITELTSLGKTYEDRDIWCLEISDNPGVDEGEPGIFFMGLHHAREWPTVNIVLNICEELTSGSYNSLVNNLRIWIIPCLNPDGYVYCHDQGHDWRKNRRPVDGGIGIDLNRNYAGSSDGNPWGNWGSVGQGSITNNPGESVYCGPSPFSEIETQVVRDIFLENDIFASISYHTHGELVLIPWGYTYDDPPDDPYITQVGQAIAAQITKQSGSGTYYPEQGAQLYPTTGDTDDWAYGYANYVQGRPTYAYTVEACSSFHPPAGVLDQVVSENWDGALVLLEEVDDIKDDVDRRVMPPIIDEMELDLDGDYTVSWEEVNPEADPSKYQLDELVGPNILLDDCEDDPDYWEIDGFTQSTTKSHSSSHSYKSGTGNEKVFSMVSADPIPVTEGMQLEFWCWYDIEEDWDMAFVEVSTNGRSYDFLDSFTGASSNWEQKQYSLDDYVGKSIFIRFRYITDQNTLEEGFYVDDITPVVEWDGITTVSNSINDEFYEITGKQDGTYYYRVKGYNSEYNWYDFSTLEPIKVEIFNNDPPATPTINGPPSGKAGQSYQYTFSTTDPDGNDVYYYIEWGDGQIEEWDGPHGSGEAVTLSHSWTNQDTYTIRVKAKDEYDAESSWETLDVTMPRNRGFLINILQNFPILYQFFQILSFIK